MKVIKDDTGNEYVVHSDTLEGMFKNLDSVEVCDFVQWADAKPADTEVKSIWHPVVQNSLFRRQIPQAQIDMLLKRGLEGVKP